MGFLISGHGRLQVLSSWLVTLEAHIFNTEKWYEWHDGRRCDRNLVNVLMSPMS